jgi:hypothetical protein
VTMMIVAIGRSFSLRRFKGVLHRGSGRTHHRKVPLWEPER